MNRLVIFAVMAAAVFSCGGPLDEEQQQGTPTGTQTYLLNTEAPPPLVPAEIGPAQIVGRAPVLEFDLSNGRIHARLNAPADETKALYGLGHSGGGHCGCGAQH